jgi:HEPN domain-containing protein
MPDRKDVAVVVSEWVAKAENDLKCAAYTLRLGKDCPADTVCFHAQQVVEKYFKALLTGLQIPFPMTHDLRKLGDILPESVSPEVSGEEQDRLTQYATRARYPGWGEVPLADARRALTLARRVRKHIRLLLPKEALRRKRR